MPHVKHKNRLVSAFLSFSSPLRKPELATRLELQIRASPGWQWVLKEGNGYLYIDGKMG